jgi:hypothetical protein
MPGSFVSDDIMQRPKLNDYQITIDQLIEDQVRNDEYDSHYFPNFREKDNFRKIMSIPLTTSICLGWNEFSFETKDIIGCTPQELKEHIEKKFKEGMSWNNRDKWHIDHIIPLSSGKTEEEILKLCHYTNLQPLWAKENLEKSNKLSKI